MDEFSEYSEQGWGSRIIDSIKSVGIGIVLFLVSFPLLWWNEGRAVQTAQSLEEGAGKVATVDPVKVDPGNEGKLVHLSGLAQTEDILKDADFGISEKGIKLVRSVEMYQWVEKKKTKTKKKVGGKKVTKTTYSYKKAWASKYSDSSEFREEDGHHNPAMPYRSNTYSAQNVSVGAVSLPRSMVNKIEGAQAMPATAKMLEKLTPTIKDKTQVVDGAFYVRTKAKKKDFNTGKTKVGDLRIRFSLLKAAEVSVVAKQSGSSFTDYQTKAGDKLSMLKTGKHSADSMFKAAMESNKSLTWILRGVGWFLMALGIGLVFRPLTSSTRARSPKSRASTRQSATISSSTKGRPRASARFSSTISTPPTTA